MPTLSRPAARSGNAASATPVTASRLKVRLVSKCGILGGDQFFGKGKRSAFLTGVVERELRKLKLLSALNDAAGCWSDEDHPELKHGSDTWVRQLRAGWDTRLPEDS